MEQTTLHVKGFHRELHGNEEHTDYLDEWGVEIIENGTDVFPVISMVRGRGVSVIKSLEYVNHDVGIIFMAASILRPDAQVSNEYLALT